MPPDTGKDPTDKAGHLDIYGSEPWCLECAPTKQDIWDRKNLGDDDPEEALPIKVVTLFEATDLKLHCVNCERRLDEVATNG